MKPAVRSTSNFALPMTALTNHLLVAESARLVDLELKQNLAKLRLVIAFRLAPSRNQFPSYI